MASLRNLPMLVALVRMAGALLRNSHLSLDPYVRRRTQVWSCALPLGESSTHTSFSSSQVLLPSLRAVHALASSYVLPPRLRVLHTRPLRLRAFCAHARYFCALSVTTRPLLLRAFCEHTYVFARTDSLAASLHQHTRLTRAHTLSRLLPGAQLHQLIVALLTCIVSRRLSESVEEDHWALRLLSADLVAILCSRYGDAYPDMPRRVAKTLLDAVRDDSKPLPTRFGALVALRALGRECVRTLVLPNAVRLLHHLGPLLSGATETAERLDAERVLDALVVRCVSRQLPQLWVAWHSRTRLTYKQLARHWSHAVLSMFDGSVYLTRARLAGCASRARVRRLRRRRNG